MNQQQNLSQWIDQLSDSLTGNGNGRSRLEQAGPWATLAGGGLLATFGAVKRDWTGAALGAVGAYLIYRGATGVRNAHPEAIRVERSAMINRPVEEVFKFWRNFENLPRFMSHLKSVTSNGERYSHWVARAPMGASISWDAEITAEEPNRYIVWRSLPGSTVPNAGSVQFIRETEYHGGTQVRVSFEYQPPAGHVGKMVARLFGEEPDQQVREDLRRLKQLLEAGEIPTTEGQSHGRRTAFIRMIQAAQSDEPKPGSNPNWQPEVVGSR